MAAFATDAPIGKEIVATWGTVQGDATIGSHIEVELRIELPAAWGRIVAVDVPKGESAYELPYDLQLAGTEPRLSAHEPGQPLLVRLAVTPAGGLGEMQVKAPPVRVQRMDIPGASETIVPLAEVAGALMLNVAPRAALGEQIKDDRGANSPPLSIAERAQKAWPYAAAVAAAIALVAAVIARAIRPAAKVPVPAHVWALSALKPLESMPLDDIRRIEEYHFALGRVLRGYLARRWPLHAEEMTSREAVSGLALVAPDVPSGQLRSLELLLEELDGVKYARESASKLTCQDRMRQARQFVEGTRPVAVDTAASSTTAKISSFPAGRTA